MQELIYKFGHAGITKAEVTIVFDNTDKTQSPEGFKENDQIIVSRQILNGKTKFFVNGHNEKNVNVKNMFKQVGLNIEQPHFLVAQGKITKLIGLKPTDLIGMLEETAGTALYNDKRQDSQKILLKKGDKLIEMSGLLDREVRP